jgi:hypothetical protein
VRLGDALDDPAQAKPPEPVGHLAAVDFPMGGTSSTSALRVRRETEEFYIGSIAAKPEEQESKRLLSTNSGAAYVPSSDAGLGGPVHHGAEWQTG